MTPIVTDDKTGWPYEGEAKPMGDQSDSINELAAALSKAQGEITGAVKNSSNPFFKSRYADLASCWDACRAQFSANGLAVIQTTKCKEGQVFLITTLAHSSGQWIRGELPVKAKDDGPQAQGSGMAYSRRYALAAIAGLAQIDDDAEAAQGRAPETNHSGQGGFVIAERDKYVSRFLDAFNMDAEELDIAKAVRTIHGEISHKHALYTAVGEALGTQRNAIRKYLELLKKAVA